MTEFFVNLDLYIEAETIELAREVAHEIVENTLTSPAVNQVDYGTKVMEVDS